MECAQAVTLAQYLLTLADSNVENLQLQIATCEVFRFFVHAQDGRRSALKIPDKASPLAAPYPFFPRNPKEIGCPSS